MHTIVKIFISAETIFVIKGCFSKFLSAAEYTEIVVAKGIKTIRLNNKTMILPEKLMQRMYVAIERISEIKQAQNKNLCLMFLIFFIFFNAAFNAAKLIFIKQ